MAVPPFRTADRHRAWLEDLLAWAGSADPPERRAILAAIRLLRARRQLDMAGAAPALALLRGLPGAHRRQEAAGD